MVLLRNILRYDRYPDGTAIMDSLTYNYVPGTNKLAGINDAVTNDSAFAGDIDNQTVAVNYLYDGNGNQVKDKKEGIDTILWNVYGKIKQVTKGSVITTFTYDASGNRISKIVNGKETWYMRDAGGNYGCLQYWLWLNEWRSGNTKRAEFIWQQQAGNI